jgi:hypothetical protein
MSAVDALVGLRALPPVIALVGDLHYADGPGDLDAAIGHQVPNRGRLMTAATATPDVAMLTALGSPDPISDGMWQRISFVLRDAAEDHRDGLIKCGLAEPQWPINQLLPWAIVRASVRGDLPMRPSLRPARLILGTCTLISGGEGTIFGDAPRGQSTFSAVGDAVEAAIQLVALMESRLSEVKNPGGRPKAGEMSVARRYRAVSGLEPQVLLMTYADAAGRIRHHYPKQSCSEKAVSQVPLARAGREGLKTVSKNTREVVRQMLESGSGDIQGSTGKNAKLEGFAAETCRFARESGRPLPDDQMALMRKWEAKLQKALLDDSEV